MPAGPRERMVRSAALLMREHGVEAMSFSQVVQHSGAPRGSIYHYFPGGKAQLVEEAARWAGAYIADRTAAAVASDGPLALFDFSEEFWGDVLGGSNFASGCPIVATVLDAHRSPGGRVAAADAFARWQELFSDALVKAGVTRQRADALATTSFAAIEGAVIISRAQQSLDPLKRVLDEMRSITATAIAEARDDDTAGERARSDQ